MSERNENEPGQGYDQGYTNGFWTGAIASFFGTVVLLYLIGQYAP